MERIDEDILIANFLEKRMTPEEEAQFVQRLMIDPALKKKLDQQRFLNDIFKRNRDDARPA